VDRLGRGAAHHAVLGGSLSAFDAAGVRLSTRAVHWVGDAPLSLAAASGETDAVEVLLRWGADAGACDPRRLGSTPLHLAVRARQYDCVRVLVGDAESRGALAEALSARDDDGFTPPMIAAATGTLRALRALLPNEAVGWWAGRTADGRTPFHDAAGARYAETLMLLRELAAREGVSEAAVVTEEYLTGQTPADAYRHAVLRMVFAEVKDRVWSGVCDAYDREATVPDDLRPPEHVDVEQSAFRLQCRLSRVRGG